MSSRTRLLSAAALAVALSAASLSVARAAVIAQFTPDTNAFDYNWVRSGGAGTGGALTTVGTNGPTLGCTTCVATHFSFLDPTLSALSFVPATFQFSATVASGNPAAVNGAGVWTQTNLNGSFSFTYWNSGFAAGSTQSIGGHLLVNGVTNLLSGVFTDAWIQGAGGSGSTNLTVANGGTATFSSPFLGPNHLVAGTEGFALNMLSATPQFGAAPGKALTSFSSNGGGNFSAVPVPEPASWALMILGFGGIGAAIRGRRRAAIAAA